MELFWHRGPTVSRMLLFSCRLLVLMYLVTTTLFTFNIPVDTTASVSVSSRSNQH